MEKRDLKMSGLEGKRTSLKRKCTANSEIDRINKRIKKAKNSVGEDHVNIIKKKGCKQSVEDSNSDKPTDDSVFISNNSYCIKEVENDSRTSQPSSGSFNRWSPKNEQYIARTEDMDFVTVRNIIKLFDEDNTIPFIARYRKNLIGGIGPEKLRSIKSTYSYLKKVNAKADRLIEKANLNNSLTDSLIKSIKAAETLEELEFIESPFKKSKKSLAERARELNLEEAAESILTGNNSVSLEAYVNPKCKDLDNLTKVRTRIQHIIADMIKMDCSVQSCLNALVQSGKVILQSKTRRKKNSELVDSSKYDLYNNFSQMVADIKPYQMLAINRGEHEKKLSVKIEIPTAQWVPLKDYITDRYLRNDCDKLRKSLIIDSLNDSIKRLLKPYVERRVRSALDKKAEEEAIRVFGSNLKQLLLTPPCRGNVVMGIDPGFSHGCKVAVISEQGKPLIWSHFFLPRNISDIKNKEYAAEKLKNLIVSFGCETIALGNGKGSRETETLLSDFIRNGLFQPLDVKYTIINEQGVSIYSCSPAAQEEFPDFDPLNIGAVSIARRLQDPLSELVKIEPKHLGVGLYQHDMKSKELNLVLDEIVSECVSFVGVDINTASFYLLKRIAGLNGTKAKEIIKYRNEGNIFRSREDLKKIKGIKANEFIQCAGFFRVLSTTAGCPVNPLDQTSIHPESYDTAKLLVKKLGLKLHEIGTKKFINCVSATAQENSSAHLAKTLNVAEEKVNLIIEILKRPLDDDIRNTMGGALFQREITRGEEIKVDQKLTGVVRNVVPFGAFVDVGVEINGLIHRSKMRNDLLLLNDKVLVKVLSVDLPNRKIGLSLEKKIH